jgi:hypothetical protein
VYYRVAAVNCDVEIPSRCPSYIKAKIDSQSELSNIWVDTAADLTTALNNTPPTLLDIFNDWDRSDPVSQNYYPRGVGATGDHAAWFFDATKGSFVQPNNTGVNCLIVSPPSYYQTAYVHEVVLQSSPIASSFPDDDTVGVVGAFATDANGDDWALIFSRTHGGLGPYRGWGAYVLGPGYDGTIEGIIPGTSTSDVCGMQVGSIRPTSGSGGGCAAVTNGTTGWDGSTTSVMVERYGNTITAHCSEYAHSLATDRADHRSDKSWPDHGGDYIGSGEIIIDLNTTPPPAGLSDWSMFKDQGTGVGFMTISQSQSFYNDWYYWPPIGQRIFDFTNGVPGEVWEWSSYTNSWYKTLDTAWEVVGRAATKILDPGTGLETNFNCDGALT